MQHLEFNAFSKIKFEILPHTRYVDKTFLIIPFDKLDFILSFFNSYQSRLKFTFITENNNSIIFLNHKLIADSNKSIIQNFRIFNRTSCLI